MIDLHCHVLPGIDDGPETEEDALALLTAMAAEGVRTVVATPHVSERYPNRSEVIAERVETMRRALARAGLEIELLPGAEVAMEVVGSLPDEELQALRLGGTGRLLVESPLSSAASDFDWILADLRRRGFELVLAHPERSPAFQRDPRRLTQHVAAGDATSITASALSGRFGTTVTRFCVRLLRDGLAHDVASDAHDLHGRRPGLLGGLVDLEPRMPGLAEFIAWHTLEVPAALIAGGRLPRPPAAPPEPAEQRRRRRLRPRGR